MNEYEPLLALALQQPEPLLRDGGRYGNFRSAGFVRASDFYLGLFREGLAPRVTNTQISNVYDEFARGRFAFYISGRGTSASSSAGCRPIGRTIG